MYDYIIIGAGYGGLSVASLLSKLNLKILIIEGHKQIGGCASYFRRKNFTFDVGATTLSGINSNQPMGKVFDLLELKPNVKKLDIGSVIYLKDKKILRYANKDKWLEEIENNFTKGKHKEFWSFLDKTSELLWELLDKNKTLQPDFYNNIVPLIKLENLKFLPLLSGLFLPLNHILKKYQLDKDLLLKSFIDEQLLISTQNTSDKAPFVTSAIGLTYPSEIYYPYGGIYKPLELILDFYKKTNNEILLGEIVNEINYDNNFYKVRTSKNKIFETKGIISNATIWNMAKITEGNIQKYFLKKSESFTEIQGAFTIYFALKTNKNLESAFYQIHFRNKIPFVNSNSIYVSFSLEDDLEKAPEGYKVITISTHTNPNDWINLSKETYEEQKKLVEKALLKEFDENFEDLRELEKIYLLSGTPKTFERFTYRHNGFVGGIPHSIKNNFLNIPSNHTPFKNFYLVGDTSFAGQGIPAVLTGALSIYYKKLRELN
ncbi:MAG: NAD(P)/FAD-dependent oxidoreductase [Candidatus Sericytochromatia bacterium]